MLGGIADRALAAVVARKRFWVGGLRGASMVRESFVPAVGGPIVVASGLLFGTGASEGCGGGVARCRSSRRTYVPSPTTSWYSGPVGWSSVLFVSSRPPPPGNPV